MKIKPLHYILLFSLIIRLYHIDFPVGGKHGWRQADTAAIAKNFYENGFNLFYPQVDWGGNSPGYVESEFQIYPYSMAILYSVFGMHNWVGRGLSVIFSLLTIFGLYLLVRKITNEHIALWSAFIYAILPANIFFSRVFMPEPLMLMSIVFGLYFFVNWTESDKNTHLYLSAFFIALSILLKIVTLYIGLPLLFLAFQKFRLKFLVNLKLWLYALLVLVPSAVWYYHAHQLFVNGGVTFNIWGFGTDKWGNFGLLVNPSFYSGLFVSSIVESHLAYLGITPLVVGLILKRNAKYEQLFDYWIISVIIYFLIVAEGNKTHDYYQLPFNLPAAFYIGKTFNHYLSLNKPIITSLNIKRTFFLTVLLLILIGSYIKAARFYYLEDYNGVYLQMAEEVKKITAKDELIITISDNNPLILYTCDRKGWAVKIDALTKEFLNEKKLHGAKIIAGENQYFNTKQAQARLNEIKKDYKVIIENSQYLVLMSN